MKFDLHVHTIVSKCSLNPIWLLRKLCRKYNIVPAICDHNKLTKLDFAIPGEEIATNRGEFIGLFLNEEIPKGLDIYEAIDRVKEQDGLILIPHPFDHLRSRSLINFNVLEEKEFIKKVDIVEVFNSRCRDLKPNILALEYAKKYNFPVSFGSDCHFYWELNKAYIKLNFDDFDNPKLFLKELEKISPEIYNYNKNLYKNPWKTEHYFGILGNSKNIELYSKVLKKIRNLFNFNFKNPNIIGR